MSLRLKLLLPLILACLAVLAYLEFVWTPRSLETQKQQYRQEIERHVDTVVDGLVPLLLTGQLDLIDGNLRALGETNRDWRLVLLRDAKSRQIYPPALGAPPPMPAAGSEFVVNRDIRFLDRQLGRLSVHVDDADRLERLQSQHRQLKALLAGIIALLALTWTATLEIAVVRPLRHLATAAGDLARQRFDVPLPPARGDEVGRLIDSFERMRGSLQSYHADLMREIAEHKLAEEQKSALNAGLEQRVAERTAALERAYKELEAFSYSVSHDLRAPLRAINGFSSILLENEAAHLTDDGRHLLVRVAENATRLGQLIDDILEYSRAGRSEMRATAVDLRRLAGKVAAELAEAYPNTLVEIGELPVVQGDPIMLEQVMQNLLGNACKFSATAGQPRVEVGRTEMPGEPTFFVRDNGVGFDMRYADRLFGMFQRMHAASDFPGTGVGLAIVKRLIERHGGRVWAEAAAGAGATFYFTLGTPLAA